MEERLRMRSSLSISWKSYFCGVCILGQSCSLVIGRCPFFYIISLIGWVQFEGGSIFFIFLLFLVLFGGYCMHLVYLGALFWRFLIQLLLIHQNKIKLYLTFTKYGRLLKYSLSTWWDNVCPSNLRNTAFQILKATRTQGYHSCIYISDIYSLFNSRNKLRMVFLGAYYKRECHFIFWLNVILRDKLFF